MLIPQKDELVSQQEKMEERSSQQEKWWESHWALGPLDTNPTSAGD